jgi:hypothetical protein
LSNGAALRLIAGREGENARRAVFDDLELDPVEIRPPLLPVVRVLHQLDRLATLVFDELERPGSDRLGAHVALRHVARINGGVARREQQRKRRLRLLHHEGRLEIAVDGDFAQVLIPDRTRVLAEVLNVALADQHMPGALHVLGGERLAVMPLHALSQLERQLLLAVVPGPALREIRHDRLGVFVLLGVIEDDQIVVDRHVRNGDRDGRLFQDRCAGRVVAVR